MTNRATLTRISDKGHAASCSIHFPGPSTDVFEGLDPMYAAKYCKNAFVLLSIVAAVVVGCSGGNSNPSGGGGSLSAGGSSNTLGTTTSGGATRMATTSGTSSTGGAATAGGATASAASSIGGTATIGGASSTTGQSTQGGASVGGVSPTGGTVAANGGGSSAGGVAGGTGFSSGGFVTSGGTFGTLLGIGGSGTGGVSSQSTCATDCNDGFSCTIDTCVNGKCQFVIGPSTGSAACPVGQYCTLDRGCVASLACATVQQCQDAWKDDACNANIRCDAASSLCQFSLLDKDGDGHAPPVCGGDDCDDSKASTYAGARELCNGIDDNCNGIVDDNASAACKTTETCVSGACKCKPENVCNSTCVDFQADAANCGSCGAKCVTGASCIAETCTCPTGQLACLGTCSKPDPTSSKCPAVVQLAPGGVQTCVLLSDGTARCWGLNGDGQLGDGTTTASSKPVPVVTVTGGIQIAGGYAHNCILDGNSKVSCWGDNSMREVSLYGMPSGVVEISSGSGYHSCARLSDGTVTCWGSIVYASDIAYATPITYSPSSAIAGVTGSVEISSGWEHSCARFSDGTVKCWGWNEYGQLGDGATANSTAAMSVQGISGAVGVAAGGLHTCARLGDGTVECWGDYSRGQLGDVSAYLASLSLLDDAGVPSGLPPMLIAGISGATQVVAGRYHSCALVSSGAVKCWGANGDGQLGDGTTTDNPSPVDVQNLSNVVEIGAGAYHTCARLSDGAVKCWGQNTYGQLGDGTKNSSSVPVTVVGF